MGDKGGKKDKDKVDKQKADKQAKELKEKKEKEPKSVPKQGEGLQFPHRFLSNNADLIPARRAGISLTELREFS